MPVQEPVPEPPHVHGEGREFAAHSAGGGQELALLKDDKGGTAIYIILIARANTLQYQVLPHEDSQVERMILRCGARSVSTCTCSAIPSTSSFSRIPMLISPCRAAWA